MDKRSAMGPSPFFRGRLGGGSACRDMLPPTPASLRPDGRALLPSPRGGGRRRKCSGIQGSRHIADAAGSADFDAGRFQVLAQAGNGAVEGVDRDRLVEIEQLVHQPLLGDNFAGVGEENFEEAEFAAAELEALAADRGIEPGEIEFEIAQGERAAGLAPGAAHEGAETGFHLAEIEGFYEVIVGTEIKEANLVIDLGAGGHDEDRSGEAAPAQFGDEADAIPNCAGAASPL